VKSIADSSNGFVYGSRFIHPLSGEQIKITDFSQSSVSVSSRVAVGRKWMDADLYVELDLPIPYSERDEDIPDDNADLIVRPRTLVSEMHIQPFTYTGLLLDDHRILAYKVSALSLL
jgi:hypothetical protein